jgi:hypothetical protein
MTEKYSEMPYINELPVTPTPLDIQMGGNHYKDMAIQVVEFCHANRIPFIEGAVIKYICRYKKKDGIKDLEKAKHMIDILIQMNKKYGK